MMKQKIVLLHQYYLPHRHGTLSYELATEFAKHYQISVITGKSQDITNESVNTHSNNDLSVKRLAYKAHSKETQLGRIRNYFSFFYATWKNRALFKEADVVIVFSTPPIIPLIPALLSRKYGFNLIFVVHDLYPDIAVKLNYTSENSIGTWIFKTLNTFLYKRCATIVVLSKDMQELFLRT
ncbi:MAG: glycosyltransferase, partial [Candidatus Doudnabacteria bacterium]|nr:glycosyltransferase [Candidatus Doudnabacteria bacterium]